MEHERLFDELQSWCWRNRAEVEKQHLRVQGERYEISWKSDDGLVQFIDVYPRNGDRVLIQPGAYPADRPAVTEEERFKGPLQVRRSGDDLRELLTRLKEHADRTNARDVIAQISSQDLATRS